MRKIVLILALVGAAIAAAGQALPSGSVPFGTMFWLAPDGSVWVGSSNNGYKNVTKAQISDVVGLQSALDEKEDAFLKGSLVAGSNITLSGALANRLVGAGDITIGADLSDYYTKTNLQTDGQAQVNWDNIINPPSYIPSINLADANETQQDGSALFGYLSTSGSENFPIELGSGIILERRSSDTSYSGFRLWTGHDTANELYWKKKYAGDLTSFSSWYKIWHEGNFNPSNYMQKSGGVFTGNISGPDGTDPSDYATVRQIPALAAQGAGIYRILYQPHSSLFSDDINTGWSAVEHQTVGNDWSYTVPAGTFSQSGQGGIIIKIDGWIDETASLSGISKGFRLKMTQGATSVYTTPLFVSGQSTTNGTVLGVNAEFKIINRGGGIGWIFGRITRNQQSPVDGSNSIYTANNNAGGIDLRQAFTVSLEVYRSNVTQEDYSLWVTIDAADL